MEKVVRIASPAKLNLHLEVFRRRSDGYHDLISLFQMVDFADELMVGSLKETDVCRIDGDFSIEPSRNTIWKATELFRERTGIRQGVRFTVTKVIPCGSGTGGGSSNAASALRALNELFDTRLSGSELAELGSRIGSDVPFFCSAAAALVEGRGEIIRPLTPGRPLFALLLYPEFGIATAAAYGWIDESRAGPGMRPEPEGFDPQELIDRYAHLDPAEWKFFNTFFPVAAERYPELLRIHDRLYALGACYVQMSGSGSAMYGLFRTEEAARNAVHGIPGGFRRTVVTKLLDRLPGTVLQYERN